MKKIFLLLVVAAVAGWAIWQGGKPSEGLQAMPDWSVPDLSKASAISIDGPDLAIRLHRDDKGVWHLANGSTHHSDTPADADAVAHLLGDLGDMRPERIVAHDATHDADLHLDAAHAIHLAVRDAAGLSLLELTVGGQGTDLVSTYVRRAGEPQVVAVDRALLWQLKRAPSGWRAAKKAPAAPASATPTTTGTAAGQAS